MRGINQAKRKCVYHEGGLSHLLFRKSMINKLLFRVQHVLEKIAERGAFFLPFVQPRRASCWVTAPSIIHSASATLSSIVVKLGQEKTAFLAHQRCIVLK